MLERNLDDGRKIQVDAIKGTIDLDRIRVQTVQGKQGREMWGIVWLDSLPFYFRAWRQRKKDTEWGFVHAPYEPLDFTPPIFTEPLTVDDINYMLKGLGVAEKEKTDKLLDKVLGERSKDYQKFRERYNQNPEFRRAYGTAVSIVCDEKQAQLYSSP